jgi:hypothetical protein
MADSGPGRASYLSRLDTLVATVDQVQAELDTMRRFISVIVFTLISLGLSVTLLSIRIRA